MEKVKKRAMNKPQTTDRAVTSGRARSAGTNGV
jgi:hypothetical protein